MGQSLIEIIIAVAVGTITILAAVTLLVLMLRISGQDVSFQKGSFLEQDLIDDFSVTVGRDWQEVAGTTEGIDYYLATTTTEGIFDVVAGTSKIIIDGVEYTRFFRVSSVTRDAAGKISGTGTIDASTKKVDVFVTWPLKGETTTVSVSKYVTRSSNLVFQQTDWSGGSTAVDPVYTSPLNTFKSKTGNIDFGGIPGTIKLGGLQ